MANQTPTSTHRAVQKHYGKLARVAGSCCGGKTDTCKTDSELYPPEMLEGIPSDIANFSAGSGDPISLAKLHPGEIVLDLGSGGGLDCFMAAREVGENGRVIGVDMTAEMLARARSKATQLDFRNIEFREGYLENLPIDDHSIDVIISNCVINLSPDKPQVFREMFRVLKPGGRIAVSDPVSNSPMKKGAGTAGEDWCGCTAGALSRQEYTDELIQAGFENIRIVADMGTVTKIVDSRQITIPESLSREKLLSDPNYLDSLDQQVVVPHLITASKPKSQ